METGIHELTAGYALDALDPDERSAYEAHLAGCDSASKSSSRFWTTTEALAVAASGPEPSPALRERILDDVRAEPLQNVVALEPRRRRLAPVLGQSLRVAAVVALAVGLWASDLSNQLDESRAALERQRAAAAVLVDPEARIGRARRRATAGSSSTPDGEPCSWSTISSQRLSGKTYELWIVSGRSTQTPQPAGTLPGAMEPTSSVWTARSTVARRRS